MNLKRTCLLLVLVLFVAGSVLAIEMQGVRANIVGTNVVIVNLSNAAKTVFLDISFESTTTVGTPRMGGGGTRVITTRGSKTQQFQLNPGQEQTFNVRSLSSRISKITNIRFVDVYSR